MGKLFFNRPQTLSVLGYRRTVFRRAFESLKFSSCLRYNLTARIFSYHACFSAFRSEAKTKLFEITSCRREEKNEMGAGTLIKLREHLLWLPIRNSNCGARSRALLTVFDAFKVDLEVFWSIRARIFEDRFVHSKSAGFLFVASKFLNKTNWTNSGFWIQKIGWRFEGRGHNKIEDREKGWGRLMRDKRSGDKPTCNEGLFCNPES